MLVFGAGGCRYASRSVTAMLGVAEDDVLGERFAASCTPTTSRSCTAAHTHGRAGGDRVPAAQPLGEWRHLEAHVTDLRPDRRIRGVVLNARDITERVRLEEQLTRQAFHDGLTGLANRALFRDRLDQALARSAAVAGGARGAAASTWTGSSR